MKNVFTTFITLLISANYLFAQAPEAFSYQGVALDAKGVPVASKQISLRISVLQGSSSGTVVLKETHTPTTDKYGQFSVAIGQGTTVSGSMSSIQWGNNSHYLKAEIDVDGGSNYVNVGTSQLLSVPYALNAKNIINSKDSLTKFIFHPSLNEPTSIAIGKNAFKFLPDSVESNAVNIAIGYRAGYSLTESPNMYINNENIFIGHNTGASVNSVSAGQGSGNVMLGHYAGNNISNDAVANTLIGTASGSYASGSYKGKSEFESNVAVGASTMVYMKDAFATVSIGTQNLQIAESSNRNVSIGGFSATNFNGDDNVAIGSYILTADSTEGNQNVILGATAAQKLKGDRNVVMGYAALNNGEGSHDNIAIGHSSMNNTTTGYNNTSIGTNSLLKNTTGISNVAVGYRSLKEQTTGNYNTGIGYLALENNTTGEYNVSLGEESLPLNTTGYANNAIGAKALYYNTTGNYNIALGPNALLSNTTGSYNIAIGLNALKSNNGPGSNSEGNIAIGTNAMKDATTTRGNTAIGLDALGAVTLGSENTAIGEGALGLLPSGYFNTAIGSAAMYQAADNVSNSVAIGSRAGENIAGSFNTFLGVSSGTFNNGSGNVFLGSLSGYDSVFTNVSNRLIIQNSHSPNPLIYGEFDNKKLKINGDIEITGSLLCDTLKNVRIGTGSLINNENGYNNTAIGFGTLYNNTEGLNNTAIGLDALHFSTIGGNNIAGGTASLYNNTTGSSNTAYGIYSLYSSTTGSNNTAIGIRASASNTSGSNNTLLGYESDVLSSDLTNITALGYKSSVSTSNTVTIGNGDVTKWVFGIPTTTDPGYAFQVGSTTSNGNGAYLTNGGTWTNASSRDFKENFEDIDGSDLLERIEKMKVQKWSYKGTDEVHVGPVAEEFKSLFNLGVKDDNKHISTLDASGIALRSVQELKKKLDEKDRQMNEKEKQINETKSRLDEKDKQMREKDKQINELKSRLDEMEKLMNKILETKK